MKQILEKYSIHGVVEKKDKRIYFGSTDNGEEFLSQNGKYKVFKSRKELHKAVEDYLLSGVLDVNTELSEVSVAGYFDDKYIYHSISGMKKKWNKDNLIDLIDRVFENNL